MAQSHLIHQSTTGENLPQMMTRRGPLQNRRNCWLGSPRVPDGYPHFHGNKKVRQKTARASLRNAISARHVKYSSMHLPHKVQKVQLKYCTERQNSAGDKKGNKSTFSLNGEDTAKRPGEHCDLSNDKPGESVTCSLPHANSMVVRKCSVTTGQKLESVVSRLWATVRHSDKERLNTTENISVPEAPEPQCDMSEMIDYDNMENANNCHQQDCSFQTIKDNTRKPGAEVDRLYSGGRSWTGQAEGSGICKEGLSLRLCSTLETSEPTCGEIMEGIQADVEELPTLEWMGGEGSPTCHSIDTSPPKLDRISCNLSSDLVTVPIVRMPTDPSVTRKTEETISCLLEQKVGTTLPDTSTSPHGYVYSTSEVVRPENYRCTAEQVQNSELLTFPQDPYPDVDKVNGQHFMSFSNQEALEAHKTVEARVEKEFRLDSRVFIQDVMEYKLLYGKQKKKKRKHKAPEGWNPGLHNRHTRYNMMLVEEVLKKRVVLSGICTQAAMQIDPTQTANTNQTSCVSSCRVPAAIMAPPSKRRKGGDGLVSKLLGCENLHWKRKARLMWDMVQAGTRHDMVQAGTRHDMVQAGTRRDSAQAGTRHDMVQAGTRHDMVQAGTRRDSAQAGTRHDMVQAGTRHDIVQAGTRHDMVQAGTRHDMVQAGTRHDMVQAGTRHDMVQAGTRHDIVQAGTRHDMVQAGTRHDMVQAGTRHDIVQAGTRHDMVQAGTRHDMVQAGTRHDMVQAGTRHDMVQAGTRHDIVQAGTRHDMVQAGTRHDMVQAGTRHDMVQAGTRHDIVQAVTRHDMIQAGTRYHMSSSGVAEEVWLLPWEHRITVQYNCPRPSLQERHIKALYRSDKKGLMRGCMVTLAAGTRCDFLDRENLPYFEEVNNQMIYFLYI
uniref:Uncharacterized protein n=1 Tax=Branchiostoma floridae TaxID=7739 RepID=C3ZT80_BRAFL|eukprot:XP_002588275.1 hypothetical protein BRAFLDRAFT_86723 [Branchiostoma floridae]